MVINAAYNMHKMPLTRNCITSTVTRALACSKTLYNLFYKNKQEVGGKLADIEFTI